MEKKQVKIKFPDIYCVSRTQSTLCIMPGQCNKLMQKRLEKALSTLYGGLEKCNNLVFKPSFNLVKNLIGTCTSF